MEGREQAAKLRISGGDLRYRTVAADAREVVLELDLAETQLGTDDWVVETVVQQFGDTAIRLGLEKFMQREPGGTVRTTESGFSFLAHGAGSCLFARAEPVLAGTSGTTWRATVYRGEQRQQCEPSHAIAEVRRTVVLVPANPLVLPVADGETGLTPDQDPDPTVLETIPEQRRRQIFDGALEVISREGYAATSIRKIAVAANISISTMYQYIDSKEDLLFMITSGCMDEIFRFFRNELKDVGTAEQKMVDAIDAYVRYISKNRRYINLVYRETRALSPRNREKIFEIERQFARLWEEIIISGNESGEFSIEDTDLAAHVIYFMCNVWALRYWAVEQHDEADLTRYLERFILRGLRH